MTGNWAAAYHGRRILVLGAGGFIGRRVARLLEQHGSIVVRAVHGGATTSNRAGTIGVDLALQGAATELLRRVQPALTLNLAGYGVLPAQRDPDLARRLNEELPAELGMACGAFREPGWAGLQLVHAGSAAEYGTATGDLSEETVPLPTTLYGRTKLGGTLAVASQSAAGTVRATTARLFTVYGPGEPPSRLLPQLRQAAAVTSPIELTLGTQQRDFTYVDDVAEGMLRLGAGDGVADAVNIATGTLTSVAAFVRVAADQLGIGSERLQFGALPMRPEEMSHAPVQVSRLERLTGWRPPTTIAEGIRRTRREEDAASQ